MERLVFGNVREKGLEVVERESRFFVRYDAGAHQPAWREDEITQAEFDKLRSGRAGEYETIIALQRRLSSRGEDPHAQNWTPLQGADQ
jgi:hypothetical protein